jgi:hypothetical protein
MRRILAAISAGIWLTGSLLPAQDSRVSGLVCDSSGAIVQGARLSAINEETGLRYAARSGPEGYYAIPATRPGVYKIAVRQDGFRTVIRMGVKLDVGQSARVDFVLQAGSVEETIIVTAGSSLTGTEDAAVSTVIGRDFIEKLPLSGRGLLTLLEAAPGVVITPASSVDAGQFSVNGQRASANYVTVDGLSVNNGIGLSTGPQTAISASPSGAVAQTLGGSLPAYSAIGSMQNLVSLEALGEFRLVTSSAGAGLGRMPGANLALSTRSGSNDFHGAAFEYFRNGKLDANDWFVNRSGQAALPVGMNDFGGVLGGPIARNRTFFFLSRESLRLRQTSTYSVSALLGEGPVPAGAQGLFAGISPPASFAPLAPRHSALDTTSIRFDHAFSPRLQFFARYHRAPSSDRQSYLGGGAESRLEMAAASVTAGLDATLARSMFNSLRVNYSTGRETIGVSGHGATQASLAAYVPPLYPADQTSYVVAVVNPGYSRSNWASEGGQRQWNIVDTLSASRGSHLWELGADYRALAPEIRSRPNYVEADYLDLNAVAQGRILLLTTRQYQAVTMKFANLSAFAQDTWKASGRLTLTYGVRSESNPPPTGKAAFPPFSSVGLENPEAVHAAFDGSTLWKRGYRQIAPRLGLAVKLTPSGSLVLRAAAGMYYDLGFGQAIASETSASYSTYLNVSVGDPAGSFAPPADSAPYKPLAPLISDFKSPLAIHWNTTLERLAGRRTVLAASYVGSSGRHLLLTESVPVPGRTLNVVTNLGASNYQALQGQVRTRLDRRLHALASFAWAHSIDNVSKNGVPVYLDEVPFDRGNSDFDVRLSASAALVYELPGLRGWSLDCIYRARSGFPFTLLTSQLNRLARPNLVAGQPVWIADPSAPGGRRINLNAFEPAAPGVRGTLGRNAIAGPGMAQLDVALERQFHLSEKLATQLRVEAFNAANHPNFGNPNTVLGAGSGRSTTMLHQFLGSGSPITGLTPALQIGGPRSLQLALRLRF